MALISSIFFGLLFFFFGPKITSLYTDDPSVIQESVNIMKIMALIQPFQASAFAISGGLRGAGDTVSTLIVTLARKGVGYTQPSAEVRAGLR